MNKITLIAASALIAVCGTSFAQDTLPDPGGDAARQERMNAAYRERFDFPFVICARLNNVESIVAAMEERLQHDDATELSTALAEIYKIAQLRLDDLVAS